MSLTMLIVVYVIADVFVLNAFFLQRAALEIGRSIGYEIRDLVLPGWYSLVWLPRFVTWGALALMFYWYDWSYAVTVCVIDWLITTLLPVPRSKYEYVQAKLDELTHQDE